VNEPTTLRVYRGANGRYTLYEDDGISQEYLKGRGTWTRMTWDDRAKRLTLEPGPPRGATNVSAPKTFNVTLVPEGTTKTVRYTGTLTQVSFE
jgi:alpha-glucosidase (family GH31 glycosyl hydrolase)